MRAIGGAETWGGPGNAAGLRARRGERRLQARDVGFCARLGKIRIPRRDCLVDRAVIGERKRGPRGDQRGRHGEAHFVLELLEETVQHGIARQFAGEPVKGQIRLAGRGEVVTGDHGGVDRQRVGQPGKLADDRLSVSDALGFDGWPGAGDGLRGPGGRDAGGRFPGRQALEDGTHRVHREQTLRVEHDQRDPPAWVIDREAVPDQPQHSLADRAAAHAEPTRQRGDAQPGPRGDLAGENRLPETLVDRVREPASLTERLESRAHGPKGTCGRRTCSRPAGRPGLASGSHPGSQGKHFSEHFT